MITEMIEIGILGGAVYLGYKFYNQTGKVSEVLDQIGDKVKVVGDNILEMNITQPVDYTVDAAKLTSLMRNTSAYDVVNFSCQQKINVEQTGSSDFPFFGIFLPGKAKFEYLTSFTGTVEYNTSEMKVETLLDSVVITLGRPIVNITEVKFNNTKEEGNLNEQLLSRTKAQEALDQLENYPYFYSLFFNGTDVGESIKTQLLAKADTNAKVALKEVFGSIVSNLSPNHPIEVSVQTSGQTPSNITLKHSNGEDIAISFETIEKATIIMIEEDFIIKAGETKVSVQKLEGKIKKVAYASFAQSVKMS
jgi:hypothetical protein